MRLREGEVSTEDYLDSRRAAFEAALETGGLNPTHAADEETAQAAWNEHYSSHGSEAATAAAPSPDAPRVGRVVIHGTVAKSTS